MSQKKRLDRLLVDQTLVESRQQAQAIIMAGNVRVNGNRVDKAGTRVSVSAHLRIIGRPLPFASRGGLKLDGALNHFKLDPHDWICMDVGASTGGFTDCLLQRGAQKVYAVDVGYGQLAFKLRQDPRVVVIERTNIRKLTPDRITDGLDLAVVDVSFISLKKVIPHVLPFFKSGAHLVALIKPQFEVGKGQVGKKGVVRDKRLHSEVIEEIRIHFQQLNLQVSGVVPSTIKGPKGNQEYLIHGFFSQEDSTRS